MKVTACALASEPTFDGMEELKLLFVRHMRARAMLRSVAKVEKESLAEIIWMLKSVPTQERQQVLATCVARAADGLVPDTDG